MSQEVELKVRKLLRRTELQEIANTAKVYVEICDQPKLSGALLADNSSVNTLATSVPNRSPLMFNNVSSIIASKINLQERSDQMARQRMSPNDQSKMSNVYSTNSSNVSSLYKVVPAPNK